MKFLLFAIFTLINFFSYIYAQKELYQNFFNTTASPDEIVSVIQTIEFQEAQNNTLPPINQIELNQNWNPPQVDIIPNQHQSPAQQTEDMNSTELLLETYANWISQEINQLENN